MPTTAGKKYTVSYDLDLVNSSGINTKAVNSGTLILQKPETVSGRQSITFTATGVVSTIQWVRSKLKDGSGSVEVFTLDNVTTSVESTENTFASTIFVADVLTYSDYYPFGMQVPTRHGSTNEYRYGYQGSEKDNEVKGEGNSYTTHFRLLDPRIGRWLTVDPKRNPNESVYSSMSNNPIYHNDKLGDSIKTRFTDIDKKLLNSVPNVVQKMFNTEYGVKVGYNSKTEMLYYDGEINTSEQVSPTAKRTLVDALKESNPKAIKGFGQLHFGYNIDTPNGSPGGIWLGGSVRASGNAWIDLADFSKDGGIKGMKYQNVPLRAYNIGRVFEHEWMGHILEGLGDNSMFDRDEINPGAVESQLMNNLRREMGLPVIRINYSNDYSLRGAIFFGDSNLNDKQAKETAKSYFKRMEDFIYRGKGKVDDIPMIILPKNN